MGMLPETGSLDRLRARARRRASTWEFAVVGDPDESRELSGIRDDVAQRAVRSRR
jgi:hypothetical protein